jgi:hypothetical protein
MLQQRPKTAAMHGRYEVALVQQYRKSSSTAYSCIGNIVIEGSVIPSIHKVCVDYWSTLIVFGYFAN